MRKYLLLIVLASLFSCTSYVELEPADYHPKIVVDGWIESGDYAYVFLTFSSPFLTSYDSASIRATFINSAKVTLTSSKGESEILTLFRQNNYFPPFVYKSVDIKGVTGSTYDLKVETMGKVVTASTTIPEAPEVSGLEMEAETDSSGFLKVGLQPSEKEYIYFLIKSSKGEDKNYHEAKISVFMFPASDSTRNFYIYRRNETNLILLNPETYAYNNWPDYQFALTDTVRVKIGKVDEESYQILLSILADQPSQHNPFDFNSTGILTNIEGGIGRWTGVGLAPLQVYYGK